MPELCQENLCLVEKKRKNIIKYKTHKRVGHLLPPLVISADDDPIL